MEIFKLFGTVMVNSADAENSLQKTDDKAKGVADKLGSAIGTAAKWGTAIVGAATAVGGAMVSAAKGTAEELDVIDKASQRMGIAAESYQELAYAAELSGVQMTTLERAAKSLVGTDLNFDDALDQLMSITDETGRTQAAVEMFGEKVAYDMQPLLKSGADGLSAMKQEANDLGLVMSQESVTSGAAMNDMFSKVEQTVGTLKNRLVADFMPYVMNILQWIIDEAPNILQTIRDVMDAIMPIVKPVIESVMEILPPILDLIKNILSAIMPVLEPLLKVVTNSIEAAINLLTGDFEGLGENIKEGFNGLVEFFTNLGFTLYNAGKEMFTQLWNGIKDIWNGISSWVSEKVSWLADKLTFWRSGNDVMSGTDGYHASGLPFVPYDGYKAVLHRGEAVISADNAREMFGGMLSQVVNAVSWNQPAQPLSVTLKTRDGIEIARAFVPDIRTAMRESPEVLDD